jgi:hypothetical protein
MFAPKCGKDPAVSAAPHRFRQSALVENIPVGLKQEVVSPAQV